MLVNTSVGSIIIYDLGSILCHQRAPESTTDITARFRSCLWICSSLTFGFVWKQHLDLCLKTFIFPLDLTFHIFAVPRCQFHPAEWHHIFLLNCPEKRTIFGMVCTSKVEYSRAMCEIVFCCGGKMALLGFLKICFFFLAKQRFVWWLRHVRRQF